MNSMEPAGSRQLSQCLQTALQAIDSVLARKEENLADVSEEFSHAVRALTVLRNRSADRLRDADGSDTALFLGRINALISVMASIEYPLAGIHWPRVQQVREELQKMNASQPAVQ